MFKIISHQISTLNLKKSHVHRPHHKTTKLLKIKEQTKKNKRKDVKTSIHEPSEYPKCSQDIPPSFD